MKRCVSPPEMRPRSVDAKLRRGGARRTHRDLAWGRTHEYCGMGRTARDRRDPGRQNCVFDQATLRHHLLRRSRGDVSITSLGGSHGRARPRGLLSEFQEHTAHVGRQFTRIPARRHVACDGILEIPTSLSLCQRGAEGRSNWERRGGKVRLSCRGTDCFCCVHTLLEVSHLTANDERGFCIEQDDCSEGSGLTCWRGSFPEQIGFCWLKGNRRQQCVEVGASRH